MGAGLARGAGHDHPLRLVVAGKGGAGKSFVAGTLARALARRGHRVLAIDSDPMPGLSYSLGIGGRSDDRLAAAAERDERGRWRLKAGVGPARAVQRYSVPAPDGVRLLAMGKVADEGFEPVMGSLQALHTLAHRLARPGQLPGWSLVADMPAGPAQTAYDWAPYAHVVLLVVEPTPQSALTARRIARLARDRRPVAVAVVASKVRGPDDRARVEALVGEPALAEIPLDPAVAEAERRGVAPIDHDGSAPGVGAVRELARRLAGEYPAAEARGAG